MLSPKKLICRLYNQLIIKFHCCVMERTTVYAVNPNCDNQMKPMTLKPKTLKNLTTLIAGSLEAAYSLNWGAREIWEKGGGETLALL